MFGLDDLTTNLLPALRTIPVLSNTPLDSNSTSHSKYSPSVGVSSDATAKRIEFAEFPRFNIDTLVTANVSAGQV